MSDFCGVFLLQRELRVLETLGSQFQSCGKQGWLCGPWDLCFPRGWMLCWLSRQPLLYWSSWDQWGSAVHKLMAKFGPHTEQWLSKSSREAETRSGDFWQSTSCCRRSYSRLNSHFCCCQLRCEAAGQAGAIKTPLHPLPGLPRVFAECQVQPASLEQKLLALILMMLGFISNAQQLKKVFWCGCWRKGLEN